MPGSRLSSQFMISNGTVILQAVRASREAVCRGYWLLQQAFDAEQVPPRGMALGPHETKILFGISVDADSQEGF